MLENVSISFLFKAESCSLECICPDMHGHLGCLHLLAIANSAAVNTGVEKQF